MDISNRALAAIIGGVLALILVVAMAIAATSDNADLGMNEPTASTTTRLSASPAADGRPMVVLEFNGAARGVDITMSENGKISQLADRAMPVHVEVPLASGTEIYWSGQSQSEDGDISCRITVDGVVVDENRSVGGYVITTCQATVP